MGGVFSQDPNPQKVVTKKTKKAKKVDDEDEEEYDSEYEDQLSLFAKSGNLIYKIIKRSVLKGVC